MAKWSERSGPRLWRLRGGRERYKRQVWVAVRQVRGLDEVGEYEMSSRVISMRRVRPWYGWLLVAEQTVKRLRLWTRG